MSTTVTLTCPVCGNPAEGDPETGVICLVDGNLVEAVEE